MSIMQCFPNYFADYWYADNRSPEQLDAELVSERLTALNSAADELVLLNGASLEEQMQHINWREPLHRSVPALGCQKALNHEAGLPL